MALACDNCTQPKVNRTLGILLSHQQMAPIHFMFILWLTSILTQIATKTRHILNLVRHSGTYVPHTHPHNICIIKLYTFKNKINLLIKNNNKKNEKEKSASKKFQMQYIIIEMPSHFRTNK